MIPAATLIWTAHATQPTGSLRCDGSFVSQSTYATLFSHLGHAYNGGTDPGDGTFKLPDGTDRFFMGKAASGTGSTLGGTGGTQDHTHTVTSHTHTVVQPDDHPAHAGGGAHSHAAHTTSNILLGGAATGFGLPVTHSATANHTHGGAHPAHTGMAVGSAGGGTTGTASAPRIRLRSWVYTDDYYGDPPVGCVVAAGTALIQSLDSNVLTGDDVNYEGATVGNWVADTNCSITTTTAQAQQGTRSLQVTDTAAGAVAVHLGGQIVEAGMDYRFTTFVRAATTTRNVTLELRYFSDVAETTLLATFQGDAIAESNSAWTAALVHGKAPTGAIRCRLFVRWDNGAASEVHYIDNNRFSGYAWLISVGTSLRRDNHTDLFSAIGTTFGSVDADHFTIPDMRGRIPQDGGTLGATAGSLDHTHSTPDHTHSTTQAADHGTHTAAALHAHDAHSDTTNSAVNTIAVITSPTTHSSQGSHQHDAHSSHTGASAAAGGSGTTGSANAPIMVVHYFIRVTTRARNPFLIGTIHPFGGSTIPSAYKLCDGTVLVRADFPALFSHIGTVFNTGGEAGTDFRIPDARQRLVMGQSASGTGSTLGGYFGSIDHTHTGPSHSHTATQPSAHSNHSTQGAHTHDNHATTTRVVGTATRLTGPTTHSSDGGHAHDAHSAHTGFAVNAGGTEATSTANPPFQAVNYIILWRYEVQFDNITEHVTALTRQLVASRSFAVITEHVTALTRTVALNRSFDVITEHVLTLTRSLVASRSFNVITEHEVSLARSLVASRTFSVITEHVPALTRSAALSRTFNVITEHVTALTRSLVLSRTFAVITEHVLSQQKVVATTHNLVTEHEVTLARTLVASRTFSVITEHVVAQQKLVGKRAFDVVTEHVITLARSVVLSRTFDVITEHEVTLAKIITFVRTFSLITEHVITAAVCMDFEDVPTGGGGGTTNRPIYVFDDF